VGKASSSKKVARAARAGGRRKVRGQRGLVFPIALAVVIVLGLGLIFYARNNNQAAATTPPVLGDHWHAAYGVYICGNFIPAFTKGLDPNAADPLGIHSHGDGVIHIHPFSSETSGKNATLGKYLDWEGVKLTNDELTLPDGTKYKTGDACPQGTPDAGKKGTLKAAVWENVQTGTEAPNIWITDFDNIHFDRDGMGITVAFVPDDTDITQLKPPTAANLAQLGSADAGSAATTTVPGATTAPGATTTAAGAATTAPAATPAPSDTTAPPDTTAPADTTATTSG
jgi:hypothetical protein